MNLGGFGVVGEFFVCGCGYFGVVVVLEVEVVVGL